MLRSIFSGGHRPIGDGETSNQKPESQGKPFVSTLLDWMSAILPTRSQASGEEVCRHALALLGPLVHSSLRDPNGALSLEILENKGFKDYSSFEKFLQSQAALNDGKSFRNPYESLLEKDEYRPILRLLYLQINPKAHVILDYETMAAEVIEDFEAELVAIDAEAFARNFAFSPAGVSRLNRLLSEVSPLSKDAKSDLVKGVYHVGQSTQAISAVEEFQVTHEISPWNYFNLFVSDEELDRASLGAQSILSSLSFLIQRKQDTQPNYYILDIEGKPRFIPTAEIEELKNTIQETALQSGAKAVVLHHLTQLSLFFSDRLNLVAFELEPADQNVFQRKLMADLKILGNLANKIETRQDFLFLHEKIKDFLERDLILVNNTVCLSEAISDLPHTFSSQLEAFKAQVEAWENSVIDMDEFIRIKTWELKTKDPELGLKLSTMIRGLEETRHQLWLGYKQHKGVSRLGSAAADLITNSGDRVKIRGAQVSLNSLIYQLTEAERPEDLNEIFRQLTQSLEENGELYQGLQAAEMTGTEHLLGLSQTCAEMYFLVAVTRGLALVAGGAGGLARMGQFIKRGEQAVHSYGRLGNMAKGAMMGGWVATAENAVELFSGGHRPGPERVQNWFKDILSTGAAMGMSGWLLNPLSATKPQRILNQLWEHYTKNGAKGLAHLGADIAVEGLEELTDQYIRQVLDGKTEALTKAEFEELSLICLAAGPMKMWILREHLSRNATQEAQVKDENQSESHQGNLPAIQETQHPANDNALPVAATAVAAAAGIAAGLGTFLNPESVEPLIELGHRVAGQGTWSALMTALGLGAMAVRGRGDGAKVQGELLSQLDQDLLDLQLQDPHHPLLETQWSVIADHLQEQGDPKGEWISLTLRRNKLQNSEGPEAQIAELEERITEIQEKIQQDVEGRWGAEVSIELNLSTGFSLGVRRWNQSQPGSLRNFLEQYFASPYGRMTRGLSIHHTILDSEDIQFIATSQSLSNLQSLDLGFNQTGETGAQAIAASPSLGNLQSLRLTGNPIGQAGAQAIAASQTLSNFQSLYLRNNGIGDAGVQAIAASPNLGNLQSLRLSGNQIGDTGVQAIAASPNLGNLQSLDLRNNQIGYTGVQAILASPNLTRLKIFNGEKIQRNSVNTPSPSDPSEPGPMNSGPTNLLTILGVGLATLLSPEIANAAVDAATTFSTHGIWTGLMTAFGLGVLAVLGKGKENHPTGDRLKQLDDDLLTQQLKGPEDPATLGQWAVIGDHLQDQGDPRGEWISLALRRNNLQNSKGSETQIAELEERITEIQEQVQQDIEGLWGAEVSIELDLSTGFSLGVGARNQFQPGSLRNFLKQFLLSPYGRLTRDLGIYSARLYSEDIQFIATSQTLSNLQSLYLRNNRIGDAGARAIAASPSLVNLQSLNLGFNRIGNVGVQAIAASQNLGNLQSLALDHNQIGVTGAQAIAASQNFSNLQSLDLGMNQIGDAGVQAIAASPILGNLQLLVLESNQIGDAGAQAIAASQTLSNLQSLYLAYNQIGDTGVQAIAASPNLSNLQTLYLYVNQIGDAGAQAIAASQTLSNLQSLDLATNQIGAAGAEAIAQSTTLSGLSSLDLTGNPLGESATRAILDSPNLPRLQLFNDEEVQRPVRPAEAENKATPSSGGSGNLYAAVGPIVPFLETLITGHPSLTGILLGGLTLGASSLMATGIITRIAQWLEGRRGKGTTGKVKASSDWSWDATVQAGMKMGETWVQNVAGLLQHPLGLGLLSLLGGGIFGMASHFNDKDASTQDLNSPDSNEDAKDQEFQQLADWWQEALDGNEASLLLLAQKARDHDEAASMLADLVLQDNIGATAFEQLKQAIAHPNTQALPAYLSLRREIDPSHLVEGLLEIRSSHPTGMILGLKALSIKGVTEATEMLSSLALTDASAQEALKETLHHKMIAHRRPYVQKLVKDYHESRIRQEEVAAGVRVMKLDAEGSLKFNKFKAFLPETPQ